MKDNLTQLTREGIAKTLENTGGGNSQSSALRSEGARHKALIIAEQFSQVFKKFFSYTESGLRDADRAVDVTVTSYGASDEHPMSIRSASDGSRWMTRGWKYVACMLMVLVLGIGQMWGALSTHQPGVYSKAAAQGGYGQTLTTYGERQYEIFGFTKTSSSAFYCYAGAVSSSTSDANCILSFNKTSESSGEWLSALAYGNGSSQTSAMGNSYDQFSTIGGTNGTAMYFRAGSSLTIKISGYDRFSLAAKDANTTTKHLTVTIDGEEAEMTLNNNTSIRDFDLSTGEHTIVVGAVNTSGSSDSNSQIYAFSLRIPSSGCTAPTSPTNGASTSSSRVVSWTAPASAPAGGYLVAYSSATSTAPGDAIQAAGTSGNYTVVAAGTTTTTLSALSASTTYNWWVRSKCGDSSFSGWVAGTAFTTDAPSCGETAQAALELSASSGTICGTGSTTFTVSGGSGEGTFSVSSSDDTKATATIDGTTVTVTGVAAGSATITVTKACDATYAEATATYGATVAAIPTANAGADKATEPGNGVALAATAAADGCTGEWTIQSGPNTATSQLSSTSSATATFTPTAAGTYTLRWTVTNNATSCSAYDEMTVKAAICSISDCGNATLTYPLNVGTSLVNTAANLVNTPSNGGSAALTVPAASAAVTLSTITISDKDGKNDNNGKAAAATNACYPTAPTMSSKIGMYNGSSYSSSNYLQFAFTVNSGYTFTPCDIQFTVQPVSNEASFRWEVTDGTNIYGYGTGNAPVGSGNGATVLTGLSSTSEMSAGTYYIRLYPYYNGSNTFRISNDVIMKGMTAEATPASGHAITKSATNGTIAVTNGSDAITSADEDDVVYIAATPNTGYGFTSWDVYKTSDATTKVSLLTDDDSDNKTRKFTMPAYAVTVGATFSAIDYTVTHSAATNGTYTIKVGTADAVSTNTTANYGQTVTLAATPNGGYGLSGWTVMNGETPVSVTNNQFIMPAGNVTVSAAFAQEPNVYYYKSASHYDGSAYKNPEGNAHDVALSNPWTILSGGTIAGVTSVVANGATFDDKSNDTEKWVTSYIKLSKDDASQNITFTIASGYLATIKMKIGAWSNTPTIYLKKGSDVQAYTGTIGGVATTENNFNELTWSNLSAGVYVLNVANEGDKKNAYISQIDIQTTPIYTVTHTLTGATTSSATKVSAGEEYSATYTAASGYTLPSTITVKVGGSTIDAENYTWNQSTGALIIPAAQVTGNIQIIIAGEFTCPEAASGDVVFSWTPKTSLADADIAAGTYDLPGEWLESVYGGSAEIYVNANEAMRIRNNQLAFNGNNAYVHLTICALAEGDKILVNSSNETNARNLWISLSTTRPANAEAAAAVIEQGKAYYITSTSPLIDATDLYIWRDGSTTQIGEVSIIRSKKFTVTYAASDLTGGEVPAAVSNIFDGQTIIVAGKGTMEKGAMLFNGWKDANEQTYAAEDELAVTANMTLTAQWSQLYTVTYAKAGTEEGTVPTQESLLDGAKFNVADQGSLVTPVNKVFGGWNDGTQTYAAGDEYTIAGANVILTAVWNNNYTVQYDANGGEGTMENGTGSVITIAANGFTYTDHKFLRWNSQPDGEGTNYAVGAEVSESLTLYAIWKEVICPSSGVIYSLAMKTGLANESVAHGQELPLTSEYATITGGEATLRNNDGSGDDKAQIYKSEVYFNGANAYLKVDMDCGPLAVGDEIVVTSENYENELYLTNTNNTSEKIETVSRSYTIVANDLLEGKSIFYIWRKSGGTSVGTITITRPAPDASVPTIDENTPADAEYTGAASAMTVSADAEAPKDLHYQWYKEAGETDIEVGTDAASYTPIASGDYYCVVTNSPTGYTPKSATSRTATITMISSDATLAWLKADGNDIALSDGVYAYEYVIADAATVAPTITAGKNEEHAEVTITQADSKTGTATVHVVAEDGETSHDYTVKFNEFSGCLTTFYFAKSADATDNGVVNNAPVRGYTVFTNVQSDGSNYGGTLTVNEENYTATRSTSSVASFGKLVVPEKYSATLYLLVRIGSANTSLQLVKDGESTPYMSSDAYEEAGTYQYNFENVQAGTYVIRAWRNGSVQNCNYIAMAAELCRYEVSSVSLTDMTLRTGESAAPVMTITPAKGAVVSQAWSFVDATAAEAAGLSINATTGAITATDEATPGNYNVKVVLNGDNALSATCTVTVITEYSQVDVTGTTVWDFATGKAASAKITIENEDIILANADGITNDETFNSQALRVDVKYVSNSQLQGKSIMFHTTVPGLLTVRYACTSSKDADRVLYINDHATTSKTDNAEVTYTQAVPAGDVTIKAIFDDGGTPTVDLMNYKYIKFDTNFVPAEAEESTLGGYEREVNPQYYGTICLPKAGVIAGATLFELAYMDYKEDGVTPYKVYYDEVLNGELEAGMPYIFLAQQSIIGVFYTNTAEETAKNKNGLYGTLVDISSGMNGDGIYMLYNNQVLHSTSAASSLPANRAYIQLDEVLGYGNPGYRAAPAKPGRRRISTSFNAPQIATGMEDVQGGDVQTTKVLINGELYILRGEKMYDATGRLVK